jgi:TRAP-type mannitol/chloroaromatic compound transport system substrate-binding protein
VIIALVALVMVLFALLVSASINRGDARVATVDGLPTANNTERFEWHLVTTWPKGLPGLGSSPEEFAVLVEQMTQGRLTVKVHGAGELVPALGVFDAVSNGSVQMGHGAAYYWKGKIPAAPFFTSVPFGMNAQEMNGWINHGGGLELWQELYEPFNLIPFPGGNTGVQMAGWFRKPIASMADIKGMKMRIPGLGGEVWTRAGGVAVTIPGGELYTSLQTGVIDATEWVGPFNDLAMGFYQVADYYYYPGWHEPGSMLELIVNKDAYQSLPVDLQEAVATAARAINQGMLDLYTASNAQALKTLVEQHQVNVLPLPQPVLGELEAITREIYAEQAANNADFARVYDSYRNFKDNIGQYHKISEHAYYETRDDRSKTLSD